MSQEQFTKYTCSVCRAEALCDSYSRPTGWASIFTPNNEKDVDLCSACYNQLITWPAFPERAKPTFRRIG